MRWHRTLTDGLCYSCALNPCNLCSLPSGDILCQQPIAFHSCLSGVSVASFRALEVPYLRLSVLWFLSIEKTKKKKSTKVHWKASGLRILFNYNPHDYFKMPAGPRRRTYATSRTKENTMDKLLERVRGRIGRPWTGKCNLEKLTIQFHICEKLKGGDITKARGASKNVPEVEPPRPLPPTLLLRPPPPSCRVWLR